MLIVITNNGGAVQLKFGGQVLEYPTITDLSVECARQILLAADASSKLIDIHKALEKHKGTGNIADGLCQMLLDILARRPTDVI